MDIPSTPERRKKERHRSVPLMPEVRHFATRGLEVRSGATNSDEIVITGMPIVYNADYRVMDMFGQFTERMLPGVATEVLGDTPDVRMLFNHDGMPLARSISGTLDLADSDEGLHFTARLDGRQSIARDLAIAIERGDVSQMSCGFIVARDEWDEDMEDRSIVSFADLLDVSAVTYPASPTTQIQVAKRMAMEIPVESRARARRLYTELRAGKVLSKGNQDKLLSAAEALQAVLDAAGFDAAESQEDEEGRAEAPEEQGEPIEEREESAYAAERRAATDTYNTQMSAADDALAGRFGDGDGDLDLYVIDMDDAKIVFRSYVDPPGGGTFQIGYSWDGDTVVIADSDPTAVEVKTTYVPATAASQGSASSRSLSLQIEARRRRLRGSYYYY